MADELNKEATRWLWENKPEFHFSDPSTCGRAGFKAGAKWQWKWDSDQIKRLMAAVEERCNAVAELQHRLGTLILAVEHEVKIFAAGCTSADLEAALREAKIK